MDLVTFPSLKTTHFETYSDEAIALAKRYFRWRCEKENDWLGKRRFTEDELTSLITSYAEMTDIYADSLSLPDEDGLYVPGLKYRQFLEQEDIDPSSFKEIELEVNDLLIQAGLQFHLIYHDLHKGISPLKFRFPMFEEVWEQTRAKDTPSKEYAPPEGRRRPGRPGIDYEWMKERLRKLEEAEELPPLEGPWKSEIAEILLNDFMNDYEGPKPKSPPKMTTIRDNMRNEFDALQARDEERYGTR
jgi:hypothetical protein